jgi:membrane protein YqaA with SNARE-associated domain
MRTFSRWIIGLFASPLGVVVLAALDSTVFFSLPFGIDAVVVLMAAREGAFAWTIPLLATAGSIAGAALTFWMGAIIGERGLERFIPSRRLQRVQRRVRETGAITLAILDLIPPPFPFTPFVLAAGALDVDPRTFFVTLAVCRFARFGAEALLAVRYGRSALAWLDSDLFHDVVAVCIVLALIVSGVTIVRLIRVSRPSRRPPASRTSGRRSGRRARA